MHTRLYCIDVPPQTLPCPCRCQPSTRLHDEQSAALRDGHHLSRAQQRLPGIGRRELRFPTTVRPRRGLPSAAAAAAVNCVVESSQDQFLSGEVE